MSNATFWYFSTGIPKPIPIRECSRICARKPLKRYHASNFRMDVNHECLHLWGNVILTIYGFPVSVNLTHSNKCGLVSAPSPASYISKTQSSLEIANWYVTIDQRLITKAEYILHR